MASNPLKRPVVKLMRVVLSNGAHLAMPTPALKTRPFYATQVVTTLCRCSCAGLGMQQM